MKQQPNSSKWDANSFKLSVQNRQRHKQVVRERFQTLQRILQPRDLDRSGSGQGSTAEFCEHSDETSDTTTAVNFLPS
jgi:hypothetical protein